MAGDLTKRRKRRITLVRTRPTTRGIAWTRCGNCERRRISCQSQQAVVSGEAVRIDEANRGAAQGKLRGLANVEWLFIFGCAAYNLLPIPKLRGQCV
jgi:hypothetical protein